MNTFEHSPTTDIVTELTDRILHSNGLDFVSFDAIMKLRDLLTKYVANDVIAPYMDNRETNATEMNVSAKDYLRMPATAHKYCAKRRDDYRTLDSYMGWHTGPEGNKHCHIYHLHIQKFPEDYRLWGDVELSDGTVFVLETKHQLMAYILAAYW